MLPPYASTAEFLDPAHCRKCLKPVADLEAHLRDECGGGSLQDYRREVFEKHIRAWPEPITPQIVRMRLAAYKNEMNDANYKLCACAVCARQKRQCKLSNVQFPPTDADEPPAWLLWTPEEWVEHRAQWYHQLDEILSTESYLRVFFKCEERLASAFQTVATWDNGTNNTSSFSSLEAAQ